MRSLGLLFLAMTLIIGILPAGGCTSSDSQLILPEFAGEEFRPVINDATPLIDNIQGSYPSITIKGKCIVWSLEDDDLSSSHWLVKKDLRAVPSDENITVFFVVKIDDICLGEYEVSKQPGYRRDATICVVYWQERKAAGWHTVTGGNPPKSRTLTYSPSYGPIDEPIAKWVNKLPIE